MNDCAKLENRLIGTETSPPGPAEIEHLLACPDCRSLWLAAALLADEREATPEAAPDCDRAAGSLTELAAGTAHEGVRDELLAHLDRCPSCLREVLAQQRDLELLSGAQLLAAPAELHSRATALGVPAALRFRRPAARRRFVGLAAAAGVAFVALGLTLVLDPFSERVAPPIVESGQRGASTDALVLLDPSGDTALDGPATFSWTDPRPAPATGALSRLYRLVVIDLDEGTTVLDVRTEETSYSPTEEERGRLRPGVGYHWIVEPADGLGDPSAPAYFRLADE